MPKTTVSDHSFLMGRDTFNWSEVRPEGWTTGCIVTPHGIVRVYAQGDDEHCHTTSLTIVHDGRLHSRDFHGKRYSSRGIVTVAKKFAKDICGDRS